MEVVEKSDTGVVIEISNMTMSDLVIEYRIGGWIEKALQISGAQDIRVEFEKSIARGDEVTRMRISWK